MLDTIKRHRRALVLLGIPLLAIPASAQLAPNFSWVPPDDRAITQLTDELSVVTLSMPGNVAVLHGPDGVLLVDNQMPQNDAQLVADIHTITGAEEVRFIVNSHGHPDHLGGNALWKARGATNIAHANVRVTLTDPDPDMQPVVTYEGELRFHVNGQTVNIVHAEPAHTNGDSVVWFEEANVVHTGDIYLNKAFPVIDQTGSLDGLIVALEAIAARADADTRIIPGHGPVSNKAELEGYIAGMHEMRAIITGMVDEGMSMEEAIAAKPFAQFEEEYDLLTGFFSPDSIVGMFYQVISEGR